MNRPVAMILVGTALAAGCAGGEGGAPPLSGQVDRPRTASPTARASDSGRAAALDQQVVAQVNGRDITLRQLHEPLVEAHGLPVLLNLVQLELARQAAEEAGVEVTEEDVQEELQRTIARLFVDAPDEDHEALLQQFLAQQNLNRSEFELVMRTNAHLRKVAEPMLAGNITEQNLQTAFRLQYGETVQVRHIQLGNMQEIAEARRRLDAGQPFEQVARELSRNDRTAPLGGQLPPFSRAMPNLSEAFKQTAFDLNVGEVSDPVQAEGAYHLIKLEQRFEPRAVKFEDVREALHQELHDQWLQTTIRDFRQRLGQQALATLEVQDPILRRQYEQWRDQRHAELRDREEVLKELEREREQKAAAQEFEAVEEAEVEE